MAYAQEVCHLAQLPLKMTAVDESLYEQLKGTIDNLFPLHLQSKIC